MSRSTTVHHSLLVRLLVGLGAVSLALAPVSCDDDQIGSPLSIHLIGPDTGIAGRKLSVLYEIKGRSLTGVIFDWDDGAVDSLTTAGAQAATGSVEHTYQAAGVFTVRAVVEDAIEGSRRAEVEIVVDEAIAPELTGDGSMP